MLDLHGTLRKEDKLKYYTCAGGQIQHKLNYHNFFNFRMCQQRGCDGKANATSNCCSFQMRGPHLSNPTSNHNCDLPAQASKFGRWTQSSLPPSDQPLPWHAPAEEQWRWCLLRAQDTAELAMLRPIPVLTLCAAIPDKQALAALG